MNELSVPDVPTTRVTKDVPGNPTEGKQNYVTLTCDITDGRPTNDIKKVTWKKGDETLPTSSRYKLSDSDKVLRISPLNHAVDDGHYSCAAENEAGMGAFGAKFHLQIQCKYNTHNSMGICDRLAGIAWRNIVGDLWSSTQPILSFFLDQLAYLWCNETFCKNDCQRLLI